MKKNIKILFLKKKNCKYCSKISEILKKKYKKVSISHSIKNQKKINSFDYLICFRSQEIIKNKILKQIKIASINFHPGPPEYRGIGCANWALYKNEKYYGVTCHLMDTKIDNGDILSVRRFKIGQNYNLEKLLNKTHLKLFNQFKLIEKSIYEDNFDKFLNKKKKIKWSKKLFKRTELNNLYNIKLNIKKIRLKKILRATLYGNYKPYIQIHGHKFEYEK